MKRARSAHELRIGVSGWRYASWRGVFYPQGLPQRAELEYAARHFNSVEINGSFYSLQRPALYERWHASVPDDFVFAVKGGRFITHMKKLRDVEQALANFFASGVLRLEQKLGPLLWQFPESLSCDVARFAPFLELLPRDTQQASALARKHASWLAGERVSTEVTQKRPIRHAFELRSPDCAQAPFVELLRKHDVACVVADAAGRFPELVHPTSDFTYVRLHGEKSLYVSRYGPASLARWAARIATWRKTGDVFVYFDNDAEVHAPFDAAALAKELGAQIGEPVRNVRRRLAKRKPRREPIRGGYAARR